VGAIVGVGVDVVEVDRVRRLLADHPERFVARVFRPEEIRYCAPRANAAECYAARFALKEAVMKLLGTGWGDGVGFRDVEAVRRPSGALHAALHGAATAHARRLGIGRIHVSVSHTRGLAVAVAVGERDGTRPAEEEEVRA